MGQGIGNQEQPKLGPPDDRNWEHSQRTLCNRRCLWNHWDNLFHHLEPASSGSGSSITVRQEKSRVHGLALPCVIPRGLDYCLLVWSSERWHVFAARICSRGSFPPSAGSNH